MNIYRLFFNILVFFALSLSFFLGGCLFVQDHGAAGQSQIASEYVSEITLPEAKSSFAYGQYRLLAAEGRWDEAQAALERAVALDRGSSYLQISLAKVYLHTKQQEKSIEVLQTLLQQHPDHAEGHELLGDLFLYQDLPQEAAGHYRQALKLEEQDDSLHMKLAMALAREGNLSAAIEETLALLQKRPDSLTAKLSLARFYKEDKRYDEAATQYRELLDKKPGQVQVLLELGQLLEEQGQISDALAHYRESIEENPRAVAIHDQMARLLVSEKRYPEALQLLQDLDDLHPGNAQIVGRIGLLQLEMNQWAEAELTFRKLLRQGPANDRSRYYLGMALAGSGDYQAALKELAKIKEGSPVQLEAVTQQAYLYQQLDQPQEAIKLLQDQIAGGLDDPIIYYYLSSSFASLGQLTEAEDVLRKGLKSHPESANLRYQLGVVFEKMERRDDARREMETVLEIDPDHADALNYIAYLKAERGEDLEQALLEAKRALAGKETSYILDTLGWIYFKLGRYEEGRVSLEKAFQLQPDDTVILEHLGDLYRALSLWPQAADTYRKILELDPLSEEVKEKLDALPDSNSGGQ